MKKIKKSIIILILIVATLLLTGVAIFFNYYNKMNIEEPDNIKITEEEKEKYDNQEKDESLVNSDDKTISDVENNINDNISSEIKDILDNDLQNKGEESPVTAPDKETTLEDIINSKNIFNILLIGTDNREINGRGRSDSMIICSINKDTKEIYLTSILRDCYLSIPGYGNNRINASYAYGGTQLLIDTIKENFKINIDRYVKVDFFSFMKIVDCIGGIDIELSSDEIKVLNDYLWDKQAGDKITTGAGIYHLNGNQTLAYSRNRYTGHSDFARTNRQRKVLMAIKDKTKDLSIIELNSLFNELLPLVTTNLTEKECLEFLLDIKSYMKSDIKSNRIPYDKTYKGVTIDKMSVISIDFDTNIKNFYRDVYGITQE